MQIKYLITICCIVYSQIVFAQWDGNSITVNNPVTNSSYADREAFSITDGAGGIISVWRVYDFNANIQNIYAQHKTTNGVVNWGTLNTPILLFTSSNYIEIADVIADGNGGAYISWIDNITDTSSNLYLQKLNSNGVTQFTANGLKINPSNNHQYTDGKLCADATGVIITWTDQITPATNNNPTYAQVFAQHYNGLGQALWNSNGVQVSTVAGLRASAQIISDGTNGVFIAFADTRNSGLNSAGDFDNIDIYAQHLNSNGAKLWGATDAIVSNELYNQYNVYGKQSGTTMIADSAGGFYIAYEDYRTNNDSSNNYYLQRLNTNGARLLPIGGLALTGTNSRSAKNNIQLVSDGINGVVAAWDENDFSANIGEAHAQRINSTGTALWGTNGVIASLLAGENYGTKSMCADGSGNYIFVWNTVDAVSTTNVLRAQKINNVGNKQWAAAGVTICNNPLSYPTNITIVKSANNNIIAIWEDDRNISTSSTDLYAAKISPTGSLINSTNTSYTTTTNGNWNSGATWLGGVVPPAAANVIVRHNVVGNISTTCNSLSVLQPAVLTINTGIHITILQ
jgi:hypothetical protein